MGCPGGSGTGGGGLAVTKGKPGTAARGLVANAQRTMSEAARSKMVHGGVCEQRRGGGGGTARFVYTASPGMATNDCSFSFCAAGPWASALLGCCWVSHISALALQPHISLGDPCFVVPAECLVRGYIWKP